MKKIVLTLLMASLVSCSKEDLPKTEQAVGNTADTKENIDFKISHLDKKINNFRTGQRISFKVDIQAKYDSDITYYIKPVGRNEELHQILDTDYVFEKEINQGAFEKRDSIEINPSGNFYVTTLLPGTFKLNYVLQKYDLKNKKPIGKPSAINEVVFNVVTVYMIHEDIDLGKHKYDLFNSYTKMRRDYKVVVDDGNRKFDTYLESPAWFEGTFAPGVLNVSMSGTDLSAAKSVKSNQSPDLWIQEFGRFVNSTPKVFTLKLYQKLADNTTNIIDYGTINY